MQPEEVKKLIETHIPGAQAEVMSPDNSHFEVIIIAEAFAGQSPVKKHQMVYAALGNSFENDIHALAMKTYTPAEWEKVRGLQVSS